MPQWHLLNLLAEEGEALDTFTLLRSHEIVLWFRVSRKDSDTDGLDMRIGAGRVLLGIDRDESWRIVDVIAKDSYAPFEPPG